MEKKMLKSKLSGGRLIKVLIVIVMFLVIVQISNNSLAVKQIKASQYTGKIIYTRENIQFENDVDTKWGRVEFRSSSTGTFQKLDGGWQGFFPDINR